VGFGSPRESWTYALRHYASLAQTEFAWEGIGAYRQLVAQVAESTYSERLYALRSHDFLVISPASGWPQRASRSSVTVRPSSDGLVRLVLYKKRKGEPKVVEEVVCPYEQAWVRLSAWLQWLLSEAA
jgi:hypothetical protein